MRARSERNLSLVRKVGGENPAAIGLRRFVGLELLRGTGLDPESGNGFAVSYKQYLEDPALHLKHAAVLLGPAGMGKTPLARSTCCYFAKAYQGLHYGVEASEAYYLMGNTVDMLKEFNQGGVWRAWTPLFLDEFEGADIRQQGLLGENSMKVLVDPGSGGSIRARYHDIVVPPNCPRVFASNLLEPEDWMAHLDIHETHGRAIRKRVLFFKVVRSVMPMELRAAAASSGIEVTAAMRQALANAMDE
jgi:hypothetical protein